MLNQLTRVLLTLTALAPVLLTYAFVGWRKSVGSTFVLALVASAGALVGLCALVVSFAEKELPVFSPFEAQSVKPVDSELLGFLLTYLLPLASLGSERIDWAVLVFISLLVVATVWATHAYYCNPLLAAFGYHFFEVTTVSGVTFILLSRRTLRAASSLSSVRQLSAYVLLDGSRPTRS
jgi:hypothetical protein